MEDCIMLVLTRKAGERIYVGSDISITVVQVKGATVRIGINAPEAVPILRGELTEFWELPIDEPVRTVAKNDRS
jgi:carbon storage regulator CsrA